MKIETRIVKVVDLTGRYCAVYYPQYKRKYLFSSRWESISWYTGYNHVAESSTTRLEDAKNVIDEFLRGTLQQEPKPNNEVFIIEYPETQEVS